MNRIKIIFILVLAVTVCSCGELSNPYSGEKGLIVLHNYISEDPKGFDPVHASDVLSNSVIAPVYEKLFQYSYLERPYRLEPCLADRMYEVSEDKLTYTIHIKKGVRFADDPCFKHTGGKGRELVADDFVYSWKRLADVNTNTEGFWVFKSYIVGLDEFQKESLKVKEKYDGDDEALKSTLDKMYAKKVEGIQAVDRYTIEIKLTMPYPRLPLVLAMNYTSPVAREAVEEYGKEFINHPVGTGPFRLKYWVKLQKLVFEKNPNFRDEYYPTIGEPKDREDGFLDDAGKKLPFADQIVFTVIKQTQAAWLYFLSGYIDVIGIPKDNFNSAMSNLVDLRPEMTDKGVMLRRWRSFSVAYVAFNMNDPLVGYKHPENARKEIEEKRKKAQEEQKQGNGSEADKLFEEAKKLERELPSLPELNEKRRKLRLAMSLAYNRPERIRIFANGRATPAQGPIPPDFMFYDPNFKNPYSDYNIEKAKQLLAEAGYPGGIGPDGKQLQLTYDLASESPTTVQKGDFFRQEMRRIGINIKLEQNTWPGFLKKLNENRAQVFGLSWVADYADPQNFFQLFYGPFSPRPNSTSYQNPEFDRLYDKMAELSNFEPAEKAQKWDLCRKMEKILAEDGPWIFDMNVFSYALVNCWRKNYKPHAFADNVMKYQTVDPDLRMKLSKEWNKPIMWPAYLFLALLLTFVGLFVYKIIKQGG